MNTFIRKFELYLGSFFISITTLVVVMNVFTRYFLKFTYFWAEEIAVACFVWTIFLGTAAAYREKGLIGVEALVILLPIKVRRIVDFFVYIILFILNCLIFYFSFTYVYSSTKITAALEIPYAYINSGIILSFGLMSFYSLLFIIKDFKEIFFKNRRK